MTTDQLRDRTERDRLRAICGEATPGPHIRFAIAWNPETASSALNLIDEQAAEIERLKVESDSWHAVAKFRAKEAGNE